LKPHTDGRRVGEKTRERRYRGSVRCVACR
jgi:hypothetical protein